MLYRSSRYAGCYPVLMFNPWLFLNPDLYGLRNALREIGTRRGQIETINENKS